MSDHVMSPEELKEFEEFQKQKAAKAAEEAQRKERENYKKLVNDLVNDSHSRLKVVSEMLASNKKITLESFKAAIEIKGELFKVKDEQRSHTFSNEAGTRRVTIGFYTTDSYADTVNEGIQIVKEVISSFAKDEESKVLVDSIMKLLSKDAQGNLKPSRIMQLKKIATDIKNDRLIEGVNIIEEAYQPAISKTFIKAEEKNENNAWINIPLGITES